MNNDIVTRLRKRADQLAEDGEHHKLRLIEQAADEIERLRNQLDQLWNRDTRLVQKCAELTKENERLRKELDNV